MLRKGYQTYNFLSLKRYEAESRQRTACGRVGWKPIVKHKRSIAKIRISSEKTSKCFFFQTYMKRKQNYQSHFLNKPPYAERHVGWCERTTKLEN
jgi:hypothetical protein